MSKLSNSAAKTIQLALARKVIAYGELAKNDVTWIVGVDASLSIDKRDMIGAAVVFHYPSLTMHSFVSELMPVEFPYIPGYLSFREVPVLLKALSKLAIAPDLIIVDGQGIAHPRRIGLASHLGVELDIPTIGCAKSRLIGSSEEPQLKKGSVSILYEKDVQIGSVIRTRDNVKPVWVSPGHLIGHQSAIDWVLRTVTRFRLPEPTRQAHHVASARRRLSQEVIK
ncbi:deoxyribonuclease V [bacterium]|nr:deoxyribonuclease V [bacterium]